MKQATEHYLISLTYGPIQRLLVSANGDTLIRITLLFEHDKPPEQLATDPPKAIQAIIQQLIDYSQEAHQHWTVDMIDIGTAYQRKVWRYLQSIPPGKTETYGEIAKALSSSARAVGNACRANPWLLIIPCHRVVKKDNIGGFGGKIDGEAITIKQRLLDHER